MMEKVSLRDSTSSTGCEVLRGEKILYIFEQVAVRHCEVGRKEGGYGGREGGREGEERVYLWL